MQLAGVLDAGARRRKSVYGRPTTCRPGRTCTSAATPPPAPRSRTTPGRDEDAASLIPTSSLRNPRHKTILHRDAKF